MKEKPSSEFEKFDKLMDGLLSVPYSELQQKLDEEKKAKAKQKRKRVTSSPASRASSNSKKPVKFMVVCEFAGEFFVYKTLACNPRCEKVKAVSIVQFFLMIKSERLLIKVAEQMKRLDTNIRTIDATLQETPKVFNSVSVNVSFDILFSMVNHLMHILRTKTIIRAIRSDEYIRTGLNMVSYLTMKCLTLRVGNNVSSNFTMTIKQPLTATLPEPPVPLILRSLTLLCMLRALPPMKASSTSISPLIFFTNLFASPAEYDEP